MKRQFLILLLLIIFFFISPNGIPISKGTPRIDGGVGGEGTQETQETGGGILEVLFTLSPPTEKGEVVKYFEDIANKLKNLLGLPPSIVRILISFGFPEEIASSVMTLALFWIFPLWLFTIIVGSLMKETVGGFVPKFRESKIAYTTAFIFVFILMSVGLIGGFALWLFLNAAALSIYMAFFVFLAGIINRFILRVREGVVPRWALLLGFSLIAFFYFLGWIRWIVTWFLTVGLYLVGVLLFGAGYKPHKRILKEQRDRLKVWKSYKKYIKDLENQLTTDDQKRLFHQKIDGIHAEWLSGNIPNAAVLADKINEAYNQVKGS